MEENDDDMLMASFDEPDQQSQQQEPWSDRYADMVAAGDPVDPIPFWEPHIKNGVRGKVNVIGWEEREEERGAVELNNVLVWSPLDICEFAYAPIPDVPPIQAFYGHVQVCLKLDRRWPDDDDDDDDDSLEESNEDDVRHNDGEKIVFVATHTFVAVKVIVFDFMERTRGQIAEDPMKEIAAMQLIEATGSQNVLGCQDAIFDEGTRTLNVVMPYLRHGEVLDRIFPSNQEHQQEHERAMPPQTRGLSEDLARDWMRQVVYGLEELRDMGLAHRDLSPENIMMDDNNALVIDFGLCHRVPYTEEIENAQQEPQEQHRVEPIETMLNNQENFPFWHRRLVRPQPPAGKLPYMAPEFYTGRHAFDGELYDVWSAGTVMFCMLTGAPSYEFPHPMNIRFKQMTTNLDGIFQDLGIHVSLEAVDLLRHMLAVNPSERFMLSDVLAHAWFQMGFEDDDDHDDDDDDDNEDDDDDDDDDSNDSGRSDDDVGKNVKRLRCSH